MKLYDTTTRCNFESHVRIDINSLGLLNETFAYLLPAFKNWQTKSNQIAAIWKF